MESLVGWHAHAQLPKGLRLEVVDVTVTWFAPDARARDADSLGPLTKGVLDALVKCGYLSNDDSAHVRSVRQQVQTDRAYPRIVIELNEVGD